MPRILLHGMRFMGHHGVDPAEQARAQLFVVDVEVEGDLAEAAAQDDLALTADYREICEIARRTIEEERFRLLEALSTTIATRILQLPRVEAVTVRVRKPWVQLCGPLDYAAVEVSRRRSPAQARPGNAADHAARAYLGLGSNQGDRLALLWEADARLSATPGIRVLARSSAYETEPVGVSEQAWYLNRVLLIETTFEPDALLDVLHQVEASMGRTRTVRWAPRPIDIDLLLYEGYTGTSERLTVPHPELPKRRFVLQPLSEIEPDLRLPDGRHIRDLLAALGESQIVRRLEGAER